MHVKHIITSAAMLAAAAMSVPAMAAPTTYQFSTAGLAFGPSELTAALGAGGAITASGTFRYDPQAPLLATSESLGYAPGAAVYGSGTPPARVFTALQGSVGGHAFSDPGGWAGVGNQQEAGKDVLSLNADPSPLPSGFTLPGFGRQLAGFALGELTLFNVRLLWIEGQLDGAAFLADNSLPAALPTFQGRLALDFVPTAQLVAGGTGPYTVQTVFLNGLQVQAVPEPSSWALSCAGLVAMAWAVRRRSR